MSAEILAQRIASRLEEMTAVGLGTSSEGVFLHKIKGRLARRKDLTDNQRFKVMNILGQRAKQPDAVLITRLDALLEHSRTSASAKGIVTTFREQVARGRALSSKQLAVVQDIEQRLSESIRPQGARETRWMGWARSIILRTSWAWGDKRGERLKWIMANYDATNLLYEEDFVFICEVFGDRLKEADNFPVPIGKIAIRHKVIDPPGTIRVRPTVERLPCLVTGSPEIGGRPPTFMVEVLDHTAQVIKIPMHELRKA